MRLVQRRLLGGGWPRSDPAGSVETRSGIRIVVDYSVVNIGVVNDRRIHSGHRGIVAIDIPRPFATHKTYSAVTKTVVNATIEADVRAPIAAVPGIDATIKTPVA